MQDPDLEVIVLANDTPAIDVWKKEAVPYKKLSDYGTNEADQETLRQILDKEKPDLVITGVSDRSDSIDMYAVLAGKELGYKTLVVADCDEGYNNWSSAYADVVCLPGEGQKRIAVKEGLLEDRLRVTGSPAFDNIASEATKVTEEHRKKVREDLGISRESFMIFYSLAKLDDENRKRYKENYGPDDYTCLDVLCPALQALSAKGLPLHLIIKPHPGEVIKKDDEEQNIGYTKRIEALRTHLKQYNIPITFVDSKDRHQYLQQYNLPAPFTPTQYTSIDIVDASDLTTSWSSTLLKEAILRGKYSISIQPNARKDPNVISREGYIPVVKTIEEAQGVLYAALTDEGFREQLNSMADMYRGSIDGKATQRVLDEVYKALGAQHIEVPIPAQ